MTRRALVSCAVVPAVGAALVLGDAFAHRRSTGSRASAHAAATTLTTIVRKSSLSQTTPVGGTLGYARGYTVLSDATGRITALPAVGKVIREGQVLYRVDDAPVALLYGSTPAYRTLAAGAVGKDVWELNRDLVALGYARRADLALDAFGWATTAGVERLQAHLGVERTGVLVLGQVVFLSTAARVTGVRATLGGPASGVVLTATSTVREVAVDLDAGLQSAVRRGDRVTITLPDGDTTPGRVSSVGTVATRRSSGATVPLRIVPTRPADVRRLDQAPVEVAITSHTVHEALVVPVNALIALTGGRYALEVVDADGARRLVHVALGLFDDVRGQVQVTGPGPAAGQRVVVPAA